MFHSLKTLHNKYTEKVETDKKRPGTKKAKLCSEILCYQFLPFYVILGLMHRCEKVTRVQLGASFLQSPDILGEINKLRNVPTDNLTCLKRPP